MLLRVKLAIGSRWSWIVSRLRDFGTQSKKETILSRSLSWVPFVIAAGIGIAWTLFITKAGTELTPDSCFYLKAATSMYYAGDFDTSPTVWPPGYPFIVHLFLYLTPWPAVAASMASSALVMALCW